ncbi:hypothetical protein LTR17_020407 [Elasticomyces elasticus]|nr:hypothetical protein LTR17_020407 [Elasticomyces elasticus]
MKFSTCTFLAVALAALSTAAPTGKEDEIKQLCRSNDFYEFHRSHGPNFMVYVGDVCDGDHLKSGLHLHDHRIEGPIHRKNGVETYGHEDAAALAARGAAAPTSKDEQIKQLCASNDWYKFHRPHGDNFMVYTGDVCNGDHLKHGLHLHGDRIEGEIHVHNGVETYGH